MVISGSGLAVAYPQSSCDSLRSPPATIPGETVFRECLLLVDANRPRACHGRSALRLARGLAPALLALCGLVLLLYARGHTLAPKVQTSVYVDGLVNPRGLAFDDQGVLYVAEAGSGGSRKVAVDEHEQFAVGFSGRVSRVPAPGLRETLADRLPSIYSARHGDYLGPAAVATIGSDVYALIATGWCGLPEYNNALMRFGPDGARVTLLDYSAQTLADPPLARREDPRADVPGGVPFGLLALGGKLYTTDGNLEFVQQYSADGQPLRRLLEYPLSIHVLTGLAARPGRRNLPGRDGFLALSARRRPGYSPTSGWPAGAGRDRYHRGDRRRLWPGWHALRARAQLTAQAGARHRTAGPNPTGRPARVAAGGPQLADRAGDRSGRQPLPLGRR